MKGAANSVTISILGKEFMVACPDDERNALLDAARLLDGKMREIQDSGKVTKTASWAWARPLRPAPRTST